MVSGLVTSPFDQSRICSGDASEIRMALKLLTSSIVLLRHDGARRDRSRVEVEPSSGGSERVGAVGTSGSRRAPARSEWIAVQSSNPARLIPPRSGSG